jgi:hypothetical protein
LNNEQRKHISLNAYKPHEGLVGHLKERLQFERKRKELTTAGKELSVEDKEKLHNLDRMKVYVLNKYVFESMANITFFLEFCILPELQKVFEDDIEELLLGTNLDKNALQHQREYSVLTRFIQGVLKWNLKEKPDSFRLKLFWIILDMTLIHMQNISLEILGEDMAIDVVINDLNRVRALSKFLAKSAKTESDTPNRPVKF